VILDCEELSTIHNCYHRRSRHESRIVGIPFHPDQIKQRAGVFGQTLEYIEGHAVIQRLNDAFDGQWSFHVKSHEVLGLEIVVLGKLCAASNPSVALVTHEFG